MPSPSDVQLFNELVDPTADGYDPARFNSMGGRVNTATGKKTPALRPEGLSARDFGSEFFSRGEPTESVNNNHTFSIFLSYLFRGIDVIYAGESEVEGIPLARYVSE